VRIAFAGQRLGLFGVVGQLGQEFFEQLGLEFQAGWKLPENRSQFLLEIEHA